MQSVTVDGFNFHPFIFQIEFEKKKKKKTRERKEDKMWTQKTELTVHLKKHSDTVNCVRIHVGFGYLSCASTCEHTETKSW